MARGSLGNLVLELSANVARLERDMGRAAQIANRELSKISKAAGTVRNTLGSLAVGLSVAAVTRFVKSGIDMADHLNAIAKRTGIATEQLSALKFAAEQSGGSFEALVPGLERFERNLAQAGISGNETISMLLGLADQFAATEDPAKKLQLAVQAFGRSAGPEMVEFLSQGRAGIEALVKKAEELGLIVSGKTAQAADEFNDKLNGLKNQASAAALALGGGFIKGLKDFKGELTDPAFLQGLSELGERLGEVTRQIAEQIQYVARLGAAYAGFRLGAAIGGLGGKRGKAIGAVAGSAAGTFFPEIDEFFRKRREQQHGATGSWGEPVVPKPETVVPKSADLESLQKLMDQINKPVVGAGSAGGGGGKSAAQQLVEDVAQLEQSLRVQIATFGKSAQQAQLYELSLRGASEAQLAEARAAAESLQGMEDAEKKKQALADLERERAELYKNTLEDLAETTQQNNLDLIASDEERALAQLAIEQERWREVIATYATGSAERMRLEEGYAAWLTSEQTKITDGFKTQTDEMTEFAREAARNMQDAMADFFFDLMQGKLSDLATNFKKTIDRMVANALAAKLANALFGESFLGGKGGGGGGEIGGWVGKAFSGIMGLFAAQGAAFQDGGRLATFAQGGIVSSPTLFRFAGGAGLMGEAGPEAIMPLKRLPSGQLGVAAAGGGMSVVMNIMTPDADSFRRSQGQILASMNQAVSRGRGNL